MFRAAVFVLAVGVLAGCQTKTVHEMSHTEKKQLAAEIRKRCLAQGVRPGTKEDDICLRNEVAREFYVRENAPRWHFDPSGAATALQGVSQGYYNAAAQTRAGMSSSVTCTSRPAPAGYSSVTCR